MSGPVILPYRGILPRIAADAFVAPGAVVIGDVEIAAGASIWYNCVLRGDVAAITVGENTNIQDGTVVHVSTGRPGTRIGANVTIGHMALIHAATVEDAAFIGMKACLLDGAVVEKEGMLAAGALLTQGKRVPAGELWAGNPARLLRPLKEAERAYIHVSAEHYAELGREHKEAVG